MPCTRASLALLFSFAAASPLAAPLAPGSDCAPDETWKDPAKADRMAMDTFTQLIAAKQRLTGDGTVKIDYKKLQGLVHDFNSASSSKQKYKDLQALVSRAVRRVYQHV